MDSSDLLSSSKIEEPPVVTKMEIQEESQNGEQNSRAENTQEQAKNEGEHAGNLEESKAVNKGDGLVSTKVTESLQQEILRNEIQVVEKPELLNDVDDAITAVPEHQQQIKENCMDVEGKLLEMPSKDSADNIEITEDDVQRYSENQMASTEQENKLNSDNDTVLKSKNENRNENVQNESQLSEFEDEPKAKTKHRSRLSLTESENRIKSKKTLKRSTSKQGDNNDSFEGNGAESEGELKMKTKRKSRLSLSSETKNRNKFKEESNQASITSFFQKVSPKAELVTIPKLDLTVENDGVGENNECLKKNKGNEKEEKSSESEKTVGNEEKPLIQETSELSKKSKQKRKKNPIESLNSSEVTEEITKMDVKGRSKKKYEKELVNASYKEDSKTIKKRGRKKKMPLNSAENLEETTKKDVEESNHNQEAKGSAKKDLVELNDDERKRIKQTKSNTMEKHIEKMGKKDTLGGTKERSENVPEREDSKAIDNKTENTKDTKGKSKVENLKLEGLKQAKDKARKHEIVEVLHKNDESKHQEKVKQSNTTQKSQNDEVASNTKAKRIKEEEKVDRTANTTETKKVKKSKQLKQKADTKNSRETFVEDTAEEKNEPNKDIALNSEQKPQSQQKLKTADQDQNEEANMDTKDNKKVRFCEDIQEFSPEPVRRLQVVLPSTVNENEEVKENDKAVIIDDSDSHDGREEKPKQIKNAFMFMMDSRHKSIGQNSPGKEAEKSEDSPKELKEKKKKLSARKAVFQDWADAKGAKKRKIVYEETGVTIEHKLKKRAKRLKKMLTQQASETVAVVIVEDDQKTSEIVTKKRKVSCIIDSDSGTNSDAKKSIDLETKNAKKPKGRRKRKREPEKMEEDVAVNTDDAVDDEIIRKHKKSKIILDDSSNECDIVSAEKPILNGDAINVTDDSSLEKTNNSTSKKNISSQADVSNFFQLLSNAQKLNSAAKNKLQLKHDTDTEGSRRKTKRKEKLKSKLELKQSFSNNSLTSEDLAISQTNSDTSGYNKAVAPESEKENTQNLNDDKEVSETSKKKIQMLLTPRTLKKWQMRLKLNFDEDDETIEKLLSPCVEKVKSEDEEEIVRKPKKMVKVVSSDSDSDEPLSSKKYCKEKTQHKKKQIKPVKLAPLFVKAKPKPKLDQATIDARRNFLHSGLPDALKKVIEKQQRVEEIEYPIFPSVSHITIKPTQEQLSNSPINFWELPAVNLNLIELEHYSPTIDQANLSSVTDSKITNNNKTEFLKLPKVTNIRNILKSIKAENPDYPVYKAFRFLHQKYSSKPVTEQVPDVVEVKPEIIKPKRGRKKKPKPLDDSVEIVDTQEQPKQQDPSKQEIWTDMYKPCTSEEIFGNHGSVMELKTWLETWMQFSEEINTQMNRRKRRNSDSGSDFESTDADSKDSTRLPGNTTILCGPHGSGKTSAVYALCNELGVNVLELNASNKRTGKRLLQELHEATQSHQVRKKDANSLTSFLKKDESSQDSQNSDSNSDKKMCLLLIEDVDIVFEQDETFITALGQLLTTSKRPVVLTTTDTNCLHLKKFFAQYPIVTFVPLSAKVMATWLQILCLVEGLVVDRQAVAELLEWKKGDIRSTLLQLQFWSQSGGEAKTSEVTLPIVDTNINLGSEELCKDDNSNIPWLNDEAGVGEKESVYAMHIRCLDGGDRFRFHSGLDLGNIWWNLPDILTIPRPPLTRKKLEVKRQESKEDDGLERTKSCNVSAECQNLKNISDVFEALSVTDVMYEKLYVNCDLEPVHKNTDCRVKSSLETSESIENYSTSDELTYDLLQTLLNGHVDLHRKTKIDSRLYSPAEEKQWRTKRYKCNNTLLDVVPLSCQLDRNPVNTDYLSSLRTMARSEVIRASVNSKRRNRFYNYLRGLGISCSDSLLQVACNVFGCEL